MTILQKLSDRNSFIYEVIKVILTNTGPLTNAKLQFVLLSCGVYVKKPLLEEALEHLKKEGMLSDMPTPKQEKAVMPPQRPKIIMP
jgi:hypothetical protein